MMLPKVHFFLGCIILTYLVTINAACPVNCTCSSYDVVCIGADFNEVIASINDLMVEKVIIRETVIRHLKKLPALYVISIELSNCLIETIEEYAFDDIPLLFEINLDYNLLTEIPKLRKRNAFSKISAKGNMIWKVSPTLFNSRSKHIDLSHNSLTDIDFLKLTNQTLRTLDLSNNFIPYFAISNFSDLTLLNLKSNLLRTENSVVLDNISKLDILDLSENGIRHLNILKTVKTPIKRLTLKQNLLYSKLDFSSFTSLTKLSLDDNDLTTLPIMPATLEFLFLDNNHLNGSNLIFPPHRKLKAVYIAGNRMTSLPETAFVNLEDVHLIDLYNNSFTSGFTLQIRVPSNQTNKDLNINSDIPPTVVMMSNQPNLQVPAVIEEHKPKTDQKYVYDFCNDLLDPKPSMCSPSKREYFDSTH